MDREIPKREPLIHDWLDYTQDLYQTRQRVRKNDKESYNSFIATPMPVVKTVFMICEHFNLSPNARYIALHLYDRFMWENFLQIHDYCRKNDCDTATWDLLCQKTSNQSKLRLMSCIQIASKMESNLKGLHIPQVIEGLRRLDWKNVYTPQSVYLSEFKVFKTVGFKVPLVTPLDCVETLIVATGLDVTVEFRYAAISLLDLSYLQHHQLCTRLHLAAHRRAGKSEEGGENTMTFEVNVLRLGASIVLCTTLLFESNKKTVAKTAATLADIIHVDPHDIWIMADVLFAMGFEATKAEVV